VQEAPPVVARYEPAGQDVHAVAPAALYLPMAHATQVVAAAAPVVAEYVPAAQDRHVAMLVAPTAVLYLPATQLVHDAAPVAAEYFPAAQLTQVAALVAVVAADAVPRGQRLHAAEDVAPTTALQRPAPHGVQAAVPAVE
jgi:hypothetical protein